MRDESRRERQLLLDVKAESRAEVRDRGEQRFQRQEVGAKMRDRGETNAF
jgi:hypothetical protein